jgi:hypothetical protein
MFSKKIKASEYFPENAILNQVKFSVFLSREVTFNSAVLISENDAFVRRLQRINGPNFQGSLGSLFFL